jgi:metal-responsive CopG/Arc/MetJ family transcriptional regulator
MVMNVNEEQLVITRKRGDDGYRVFSVRVREDIVNRIDEISSESGRSRNEVIGLLLEFAVDRCRIE